MNILYTEYTILKIFSLYRILATCACLQKQSFSAIFSLYWIYFLPFKIFQKLCAYPEKQSLPWNFSLYSIHFLHSVIFEELALALNLLYWIYFFTVTCGEVRDWAGTVSFKAKFASVWIEWSSINSPLNWLLAEWLLLMLSIPYHNLLHTYGHNGDSRFKKSNIKEESGGPNWSDLSPTGICLTALLKSWNSLTTYAYVQNACSDPIENADHQFDRQLQRTWMKYAK